MRTVDQQNVHWYKTRTFVSVHRLSTSPCPHLVPCPKRTGGYSTGSEDFCMPKSNKLNRVCDKRSAIEQTDNLTFMRGMCSESMKMILTSPPYNQGKYYESKDNLEDYIQKQTQTISECVRLLHPNGSLCWQVGNHVDRGEVFPLDIVLYHIFKDHGLKLRNRIVWHFEHGLHCTKRLSGRHETIL